MGESSPGNIRYLITDEVAAGTFIGNVVTDWGLEQKYPPEIVLQLRFKYLNTPTADFAIDEETGVLRTSEVIDRDVICPQKNMCEVKLDIAVQPAQYFETIKVNVEILDINDNVPTFPEPHVTHQILESASSGASFVLPNAIDDDSPQFGIRGYDIESNTRKFDLQVTEKVDGSTDVRLILKEKLDREAEDEYRMTVIAYDGGEPPKSGSIDISITVLDANDHNPEFEQEVYEITVPEDVGTDVSILKVHAVDPDAGRNGRVVYSFSERTQSTYGDIFGIDSHSGDIFVKGDIDYETAPVYHLAIVAEDKGPDSLPDDATVIVRVQDINDHVPEITVNTLSATNSEIAEILEDTDAGTFVAHITVEDKDKGINGEVECSLNSNDFILEKLYDTQYKIVTARPLDRETEEYYEMELLCQDKGEDKNVEIARIKVRVKDKNDHSPEFKKLVYKTELLENNLIGAYLAQVTATDKDTGDNAKIEYSVAKDAASKFSVDPKSGYLTAAMSFDREKHDIISFYVLAIDHGEPAKTGSALVHVDILDLNDERPTFKEGSYSFSVEENTADGRVVGNVEAVDLDEPPFNEFSYSLSDSEGKFSINPQTGVITSLTELDREQKQEYVLEVTAEDKGDTPLTGTVSVRITVKDINDMKPQFDFPTPYNNTIYLSNQVPPGYHIATIQAHDVDDGKNAQVEYFLNNNAEIFEVNQYTGYTYIIGELSTIEHEQFEVIVIARDLGELPLQSQSTMYVMVNKSIPFIPDKQYHKKGLTQSLIHIIVIIVASSAFIITVILVTAIICLRCRMRNKDFHGKYNCRTEAMKMLQRDEQDTEKPNNKVLHIDTDNVKDYGSFTVENEHTDSPTVKRSASDKGLHMTHIPNGSHSKVSI